MTIRVDAARQVRLLGGLRPGGRGRDVAVVAAYLWAVRASSSASVEVSGSPVPITAQSLAVIGGGITLGPVRASVAAAAHGLLGAAGVRGLAPGSRAARGYVAGFLLAAPAVGCLAARGKTDHLAGILGVAALGHAIILAAGAAQLRRHGSHRVWDQGVRPFLAGAIIKSATLAVATALARRLAGGTATSRQAAPSAVETRRASP